MYADIVFCPNLLDAEHEYVPLSSDVNFLNTSTDVVELDDMEYFDSALSICVFSNLHVKTIAGSPDASHTRV